MKIIGLTGGVGMGKSTAAQLLQQLGVPVVDTDVIAREVVEPGQPALEAIRVVFGQDVIGPDGSLRRDQLAQRVFADADARKSLEAILHPRIRERWLTQAATWRKENRAVAAVVIPLLFETKAESEFDATVCVACSPETQRQRLKPRGWTDSQIEQRIQAQWPVRMKMGLANYVIWTEGALEAHAEQLRRVLRSVQQEG